MSEAIDLKELPETNTYEAWIAATDDPTPGGAWKEQQKIIDQYDTALMNAIEMLKKQKTTISDLKVFTEKLLMDLSNLEMENVQLQGNKVMPLKTKKKGKKFFNKRV